jgi:hypothetical protein
MISLNISLKVSTSCLLLYKHPKQGCGCGSGSGFRDFVDPDQDLESGSQIRGHLLEEKMYFLVIFFENKKVRNSTNYYLLIHEKLGEKFCC